MPKVIKIKKVDIFKLTKKEALSVLSTHKEGRKLRVHTFTGASSFLMGCDIDLSLLKSEFKTSSHICLSGNNMLSMGHGIAYYNSSDTPIFLETDKEKLTILRTSKGLK